MPEKEPPQPVSLTNQAPLVTTTDEKKSGDVGVIWGVLFLSLILIIIIGAAAFYWLNNYSFDIASYFTF